MIVCSRCILDSHIPHITFNQKGECNYCQLHDRWEREYPVNPVGFTKSLDEIREAGRNMRYDCIVGLSGGCDSSFLLSKTVEWGLKPLAVHFDNNWNTKTAESNMRKLVKKLNVDFYKLGVNQQEYDDVCRSFLLASVPDADIPYDIALATSLYLVAEAFHIKHILIGHSFRTEGTTPLGWSYMDAKYIETVQNKFGSHQLETFPNLWLKQWLGWIIIDKIKRVRPLWHIDYQKEQVKKLLNKKFGWQWYGGHHLENKYTIFVTNYLQPSKFDVDLRYVEYSALVRSGQMTREDALTKIKEQPQIDPKILGEVKQRLKLSDTTLQNIMKQPVKSHHDYKTYHPTFKRWRWFFWLASKLNLVPKTFYIKYTR